MKHIFVITGLLTCICSSAQNTLDLTTFENTINSLYAGIASGKANNSVGNYASTDIKDASATFSGFSVFKNKLHTLNYTITGAVSDGITSIFTNSRLNTGISIDLQYNFLRKKPKVLSYSNNSLAAVNEEIRKINNEHAIKSRQLNSNHARNRATAYLQQLNSKKNQLGSLKTQTGISTFDKDSLEYEYILVEQAIDSINIYIGQLPAAPADQITALNSWRAKAIKKAKKELEILGFDMSWFTVGFKVSRQAFKRFDGSKPISEQVTAEAFTGYEANVQFSRYKWGTVKPYTSYYFNIGAGFAVADNFSGLKKTEISETREYGANPGDRTVNRKYNAYTGSYEKDINRVRLYADYYRFLFNNNTGAIHIFPEYAIQENEKPNTNVGIGFFFTFKDAKDETGKSKVNVEAYYQFQDVFKTSETTYRFFERNDVGLRFTFPIKFITK